MPKITLLGAGSGFTQPLFTDILNVPGLDEGVIGLVDIDADRLEINVKLMRRILDLLGKKHWTIQASPDRRKVMRDTDYLISTIEVSGVQCVRHDNDIPLKYGIDQCIGDTIGPGGVMKTLRTLPPFLEILEDAKRFCPTALIMNYTNPISMISLGAVRTTNQPYVGLCHSVQGNSRQIAEILGVPYEELEWQCAGINHLAWFTTLRWRGFDMHGRLRAAALRPEIIEAFPIRTDLITNLGYFSTESCGHFSEYVPYYRKRKDLLKKHCRDGYKGGTSFYADNWPDWRKATDLRRREMAEGTRPIGLNRGHEYASDIIEAHRFDRKKVIYASVKNTGLISNLPQTGVVEVATLVDKRGFMPTCFGELPEQCAALCRANMAVFELAVQGVLNHDREAVIHAMMMDPLAAAVCSLCEIRSMAEELFAAEKDHIPGWCAKPKAVAVIGGYPPVTDFVRTPRISRILPHQPIDQVEYPSDMKVLGLKSHTFSDNFCNRHAELEKAGAALVYYAAKFNCGTAMPLKVLLGYDGPVKMWIDGKEVYTDPNGSNPAEADEGEVIMQAAKGGHEVLVALDSNGGNAWGIYLRFERRNVSKQEIVKGLPPSKLPTIEGGAGFESKGVEVVSSMSARSEHTARRRK
jgi:alpha-galactosidase